MGGTFDPIHIGHLLLAQQACVQFALDKVLFMPSSQPPHKDTRQVTSAVHRQAMTKLAVQGNSRFIYSDLELLRTGTTYTSDTLTELHTRYPDTIFHFIMGADSLFAVDSWHEPETPVTSSVVAVMSISVAEELAGSKTKSGFMVTSPFSSTVATLSSAELHVTVWT